MSDITFQDRIEIGGDLTGWLTDHIFQNLSPLPLGSVHHERHDGERCWHRQEWDLLSSDEPGFENYDESAILLKRKSDGKVIEVELDVNIWEVEPEEPDETYTEPEEPDETYTVVYDASWGEDRIPCDSYQEALDVVKYDLPEDARNVRIE